MKGIFHEKMGTIKDRNIMNLKETEVQKGKMVVWGGFTNS